MPDYNLAGWLQKFQPIDNHFDPDASWGGIMFETYGDELTFVAKQKTQHIWTYIDTDSGTAICAGFHLANRIGYFVTKYPYPKEDANMENHICVTVISDGDN